MVLKRRFLSFALPILLCIVSSCKTLSIESYTIETPLIEKDDTVKIILLSDLHSTIFGKNQSPLIEMVKEQNPDLIVLSGDILDDKVPNLGTELLLSGISGIAPMYYVTGNHEYRTNDIEKIRELIMSYNVCILSDTYVKIDIRNNEMVLAGIEDSDKK
jgi:predicted MPP superfamily phosphohydrolase